MLKNILLLLSTLFLLGCQQKHFSHVYDKKEIGTQINIIAIKNKENNNTINIKSILKHHGFTIKPQSHYRIQVSSKLYPKRCNNPLATAEQKSYIGFVQLILFKEQKRIYMCQSDFRKIQKIESITKGLIKIMKKEMKIK